MGCLLPLPTITGHDAALLEENFLERFEAGVQRRPELPGAPGRRFSIEVFEIRRRFERERRALEMGKTLDTAGPQGRARISIWRERGWLKRHRRPVAIASAIFHPEADFIAYGTSRRPLQADVLSPILDRIRSMNPRCAALVALASTGWHSSVSLSLPTDPNLIVIPARFDRTAGHLVFSHPEPIPMAWFDFLRSLFRGVDSPPPAETPPSTRHLLARIENSRSLGESALTALHAEIGSIEDRLQTLDEQKNGSPRPSERSAALMENERLQRRLTHCQERLAIHGKSLRMADDMAARLEQIEALGASGVSQERIQSVVSVYENRLQEFLATADAARALSGLSPMALMNPVEEGRDQESTNRSTSEGEVECLS